MKVKIGTQLEEEVFHDLKVAAAKEKRAIGEVIQHAIAAYLLQQPHLRGEKSGLARLLESPPLTISEEQFRETMQGDFWDQ